MAFLETKALVIKETKYGEGNKILTLLSPQYGKIQAGAPGARSYKSKLGAGCMLFGFSDFVLKTTRDRCTVTAAESIHSFYALREDLNTLALTSYLCDLLCLTTEGQQAEQVVRLGLNTLYALADGGDTALIKPAFELRLMCELGFAPQLDQCGLCGSKEGLTAFSPADGTVLCHNCKGGKGVAPATLQAMAYISTAPLQKLFAFRIAPQTREALAGLCEEYALLHGGKRPKSLDFFHSI